MEFKPGPTHPITYGVIGCSDLSWPDPPDVSWPSLVPCTRCWDWLAGAQPAVQPGSGTGGVEKLGVSPKPSLGDARHLLRVR